MSCTSHVGTIDRWYITEPHLSQVIGRTYTANLVMHCDAMKLIILILLGTIDIGVCFKEDSMSL